VPSSTTGSQRTSARPRVFYVSYDGIEEPLGSSQVLPYLRRLASEYAITLVSFEKSARPSHTLASELEALGIEWRPLRYHKHPPILSTVLDVIAGRRELIRAARRSGRPAIMHVRSYVPALMALLAQPRTDGKLLFDIRGFWADERVEGGIWRAGGVLFKLAKRCERWFFAEADAVVTLTYASVSQIRSWTAGRDIPIEVIPTCVDLTRFLERPERPDGPRVIWNGSIGTWYRFDLCPRAASVLDLPLEVITRQTALAAQLLEGYPAVIRAATPEEIPKALFAGDVGLCLIASTFSKIASGPTRFAEYLASGMPVLVTTGVGDLAAIVEDRCVGAVLSGEDDEAFSAVAAQLQELVSDATAPDRCRDTARELFDVDTGAARYGALYARLCDESVPRSRPA
jgi:glycosyltransferase involved in cell wall biosynthesis